MKNQFIDAKRTKADDPEATELGKIQITELNAKVGKPLARVLRNLIKNTSFRLHVVIQADLETYTYHYEHGK